jgi:hypothetical protein
LGGKVGGTRLLIRFRAEAGTWRSWRLAWMTTTTHSSSSSSIIIISTVIRKLHALTSRQAQTGINDGTRYRDPGTFERLPGPQAAH